MARRLYLPLFCVSALFGCTDVGLSTLPKPPPPPIDNFLRVTGTFCTQDPAEVEFPVKILFVVDTSNSMSITDPPNPADSNYTGRTRAVIDVVNALAGQRGVEIAILTFHSSINDLTGGFVPDFTAQDVSALTMAAANLNSSAAQTNYEGALDAAYQLLLADMNNVDDVVRSRSKYVVIFLSDGLPNPIDPPDNAPETIVAQAEDIQDLERLQRLEELKLHTVYLSGTTPPQFQQEPIALLREMSEKGAGTFRNVGNGEDINFLDIGFTSFRRTFALKSFIVQNTNSRSLIDIFDAVDSDGDGLTDREEEAIGTNPSIRDTDGDGFNDLLENRLSAAGFDPLDGTDADCQVTPQDDFNQRDDDGDGLLNCEERFLGTNQRVFDTDADGMPDSFELREELSAVDDDFFGDLDRDEVANGFELRDHTNPRVDDRALFADLRYYYIVKEIGFRDSEICYSFDVQNIRLTSTFHPVFEDRGWNTIQLVFGQTPADDPEDFGDFRIACVRARYLAGTDEKVPASGSIELSETDFKKPANKDDPNDPDIFDPDIHCVSP